MNMCHPLQWGKRVLIPTEVSFLAVPLPLRISVPPPAQAGTYESFKWPQSCQKYVCMYVCIKCNQPDLPQRNLIKENTWPCWFCPAARSILFALHKSQASRFGPIFPNLFWTIKDWNRDLRRHRGSMPHWRICFVLRLLRLLLES